MFPLIGVERKIPCPAQIVEDDPKLTLAIATHMTNVES
jgi:hypothetical protein